VTLTRKLAATAVLSLALAAAVAKPPGLRPAAPAPLPAAPAASDPTRLLDELARASGGRLGVHAVHVESGRALSHHAGERFRMASTYKLPIAVAALRLVDAGKIPLERRVAVGQADLRRGMGNQLRHAWKPGMTQSFRQLLDRMMTESDNTATDLVLRALGGPKVVAAMLKEQGLTGIDVSRSELEIDADFNGVTVPADGRIRIERFEALRRAVPAARRTEARARFEADRRDTATPEGMTRLLSRLSQGEILSPASRGVLFDLLRRNRTGDRRIRALLPAGTVVLDKTGTMDGVCNDVGLIVLPDGTHVALAIYTEGVPRELEARERTVAEAARIAHAQLGPS